jgi:toxin ParE1/3/4
VSKPEKPVYILELADQDILQVIDGYSESSPQVIPRFISALEATARQIRFSPAAGSLRYAGILEIPELRFKVIAGFPYLVFYREHADRINIWRVLHASRDIPSSLDLP